MNSKMNGTNLKRLIKDRSTLIKILISLILSNIFFYLLFTKEPEPANASSVERNGQVEIQLNAELLTPFQKGKKVLLIHRKSGIKIEALLEQFPELQEGRITVSVQETDAEKLLKFDGWEIVPHLKTLTLSPVLKGDHHEISY